MASFRYRYIEVFLDCRRLDRTLSPLTVVHVCRGDCCCSFAGVEEVQERTARHLGPSCSHWDKETLEGVRMTSLSSRDVA